MPPTPDTGSKVTTGLVAVVALALGVMFIGGDESDGTATDGATDPPGQEQEAEDPEDSERKAVIGSPDGADPSTRGTIIQAGALGSRGSGLSKSGGDLGGGSGEDPASNRGTGRSGFGRGDGRFGATGSGGVGTIGGEPVIDGALERSLVDAVVKRHMNQIRYCYQRELSKSPELGGTITVAFEIAADGRVSSASTQSSTMANEAVETCIIGRFQRFSFPAPTDAETVRVSYPLAFTQG